MLNAFAYFGYSILIIKCAHILLDFRLCILPMIQIRTLERRFDTVMGGATVFCVILQQNPIKCNYVNNLCPAMFLNFGRLSSMLFHTWFS